MHTACFDPLVMRQARIGSTLRHAYDAVTAADLPDQLEQLLHELDQINLSSGSN